MKDEDKEAISRIKRGDTRAFESIIKRYEKKIFNFGLRMCGSEEDAKDLLQNTFMTAYSYIKRFRGEADLSTWLYKIASSVCLKRRRKGKFEPRYELSLDDIVEDESIVRPQGVPALPDSEVIRGETKELINRALQELPAKYRIVLVLRDMEGFSAKEVSRALGLGQEAVKSRLHRARVFMREQLRGVMQ